MIYTHPLPDRPEIAQVMADGLPAGCEYECECGEEAAEDDTRAL